MLHIADRDFYKKIKNIFKKCDSVLYEPITKPRASKPGNTSINLEILISDTNDMLMDLFTAFMAKVEKGFGLGLIKEGKVFDRYYELDNWHHADLLPDVDHKDAPLDEEFDISDLLYEKIEATPEDIKESMIVNLIKWISEINSRVFYRKDLAESFAILFNKDSFLYDFRIAELQKKRDIYCFDKFDEVAEKNNCKKIGIKFGAGHIKHQRYLLEKRGYRLKNSENLCAIKC